MSRQTSKKMQEVENWQANVQVGSVCTRELMRKWRTGEQVEEAGECGEFGLFMEFVVKNFNKIAYSTTSTSFFN